MSTSDIVLAIITTSMGVVAGWIITIKLTKNKKPLWCYKANQLFKDGISTIDGLKITYKDSPVENFSSFFIAFWNNGKEAIRDNDIAETINVSVSNGKIYDARRIHQSTQSNDFNVAVSKDETSANITFKYINFKEGVVVQLFTDCSETEDIAFGGKIMDCKNKYKKSNKANVYLSATTVRRIVAIILTLLLGSLSSLYFGHILGEATLSLAGAIMILIPIVTGTIGGCILALSDELKLKLKLPKDLRKYFK